MSRLPIEKNLFVPNILPLYICGGRTKNPYVRIKQNDRQCEDFVLK